jgi:hypothetical protein
MILKKSEVLSQKSSVEILNTFDTSHKDMSTLSPLVKELITDLGMHLSETNPSECALREFLTQNGVERAYSENLIGVQTYNSAKQLSAVACKHPRELNMVRLLGKGAPESFLPKSYEKLDGNN